VSYVKKHKRKYYFRKEFPWAIKALERDNYKCVHCGTDKQVVVHHIDKSRKTGILNNDLRNLMSLCRFCHAKIHDQTSNSEKIVKLRKQGNTFSQIANTVGLTRQRVHQLYKKHDEFRGIDKRNKRVYNPNMADKKRLNLVITDEQRKIIKVRSIKHDLSMSEYFVVASDFYEKHTDKSNNN
jgi:hypothetical protein